MLFMVNYCLLQGLLTNRVYLSKSWNLVNKKKKKKKTRYSQLTFRPNKKDLLTREGCVMRVVLKREQAGKQAGFVVLSTDRPSPSFVAGQRAGMCL